MDKPVEDAQTQDSSDEMRVLPGKKQKRSRARTLKDIAIIVVVVAVVAGLTGFIMQRLDLKRDVIAATKVTDQVVADISKHDGGHAYKLGTDKFQKETSRAELIKQFGAIQMVTEGKPSVDTQALVHRNGEKIAFITYKYPPKLANQSFYILIGVTQQSDGSWKLTDISGSADKSQLLAK